MHRVALVLGLVGSLSAQEVPSAPAPVEQLPGAGRPIDIAATAAGDLVVVDIGAEYGQYSADVTRTLPVNGTFTARHARLSHRSADARTIPR